MATVRATCPDCGAIEADSTSFRLSLCENNGVVSYSFRCPECLKATCKVVSEDAKENTVNALRSVGVGMKCWTLPRELGEHPATAPALNDDDLIDFVLILDDIEYCEDIPGWENFRNC